ncbi:hypothetical protein BDF19DRAFT_498761 [Syncephalis fuscata]|nr:hypothetical protein BDF19DRAFT_498761 [Syncephalis fuscata]
MSALLNILAPLIVPGQTTHKLPMNELLNAPLEEFLENTMRSAPGIFDADGQDRRRLLEAFDDLSDRREKAAVFQKIFHYAAQTCMVDRDRSVILWVQTLVETLFGYAVTSEEAEREIGNDIDAGSDDDGQQSRGLSFAAATKQYTPKRTGGGNNQGNRPAQRRGNKDNDAYVPSDNDDDEDDYNRSNRRGNRNNNNNNNNNQGPTRTNAGGGKGPHRGDNSDYQGGNNNYDNRNDRRNDYQGGGGGGNRRRKEVYISDEAHAVARKVFSRPSSSEGYTCSAHFFPSDDGYAAFLATLEATQKTMDICIFTLTDDKVVDKILDAKSRGVQIRLISDDTQSKCLGADPYRLRDDYGIPVVTDHNIAHMHNKFAILDSRVLITGSYNWTKAAHYNNNENMIILNHAPTIKDYEQEFERLWRQFNDEERRGIRASE